MRNEIMNKVTRSIHKVGFQLKKHSPEILMVAGVVGTVASTVMACKATTKLDGILETAKEKIDTIHNVVENPEQLPENAVYTVEDSKKDLAIVYTQTAVDVIKLYAPAVVLGALSISAIVASNGIQRKRITATATAYAAERLAFKQYRERLVERFGEDIDRELRYNIKAKEIEEIVVNEDGTVTTVTKTVEVVENPSEYDITCKFFDESCRGWEKNAELNLMFLKKVQAWANDKLHSQGFLFINDVYEALGIDKTGYGQVIGWVYDKHKPDADNYVDFGIYDLHRKANRAFVNGYERSILLNFNHDGNILEYL